MILGEEVGFPLEGQTEAQGSWSCPDRVKYPSFNYRHLTDLPIYLLLHRDSDVGYPSRYEDPTVSTSYSTTSDDGDHRPVTVSDLPDSDLIKHCPSSVPSQIGSGRNRVQVHENRIEPVGRTEGPDRDEGTDL